MYKTITCEQCNILVINNVPCHEQGCPDFWKHIVRECDWCGTKFQPEYADHDFCCLGCGDSYYD